MRTNLILFCGMQIDPEQMRMAAKMMESMSPQDLERMTKMASTMGVAGAGAAAAPGSTPAAAAAAPGGGGGGASGSAAGLPPGFDPSSMSPDMMNEIRRKMEDPETMKMMQVRWVWCTCAG
jgi:hypothetical protein